MRWLAWAIPLAAVAGLATIALRLSMAPALAAIGFDPWLGFLFSPVPMLRLAAALQLMGASASAIGGLAAIFWGRK